MLKGMIITVLLIILALELFEHLIFPVVWTLFKGRTRSSCGAEGMIGRVVEIQRWNRTGGKVLCKGELWSAVCEAPLPVGSKAVVRDIEDLTLKLKPFGDEDENNG
jgi:membrane-bound ClpP family serine protease